jgi:hypothetical protein
VFTLFVCILDSEQHDSCRRSQEDLCPWVHRDLRLQRYVSYSREDTARRGFGREEAELCRNCRVMVNDRNVLVHT